MERTLKQKEEDVNEMARIYVLPNNQDLIEREKILKMKEEQCSKLRTELFRKTEELNHLIEEQKKCNKRIYLNVSFEEKERAKKLGAKWDTEKKQWYAPNSKCIELIDIFT